MIRGVDLVSYLPPFMAGYKEIGATLTAEDPEFVLVWEAADRVLKNEFIATADSYGISRFEGILGLIPSEQDTLEIRRKRVSARWAAKLPYTWRMLLERLASLCGENAFKVSVPVMGGYGIEVSVSIDTSTEPLLYEVQQMLEGYLPANLTYKVTGVVEKKKEERIFVGTTRCSHIKIHAGPEPAQYKIQRDAHVDMGIGTLEHIRAVYRPRKGEQI